MRSRLSWWSPYVVAILAVATMTVVRMALEAVGLMNQPPFILFTLAVVAAAWLGGFGPGALATVLAVVVGDYMFFEPRGELNLHQGPELTKMLLFTGEGLLLSWLGESNRTTVLELRHTSTELEQRVEQRTAQLAAANRQLMNEVHERTQAEQQAKRDRNFLAAILESLHDGIVACDADGKLTLFNRATSAFHGLPAEPLPAEQWATHYNLYHTDGTTPMTRDQIPLFRALQEGHVENVELVIVAKDQPPRQLLASGRAIYDEGNRKIGAVVSMHDITERALAQRKLEEFAEELQRSNKELQDFASVASHDLQEPLRKIQAFGDRLRDTQADRLTDQGRDYLARMHSAASRMQILINDLLAFARVTTKARPFERVNLEQVARDVAGDLEGRLDRSGGSIEIGPLPTIDADSMQMRQLLQNLMSNGLKFNRPGVAPSVRVYEQPAIGQAPEASVRICVADNGIGFDERYLDRIFGIFQRLHGRGEYEGTGVGLAVCRKIVERHGGQLTARSREGEGSTFIITLPRRQLDKALQPEDLHERSQTDHHSVGR